jgi:hypothetical protein
MSTAVIRCANCSGAVTFPPGHTMTTCEYCGYQLRLDGASDPAPAAGPALATSISIRATSGQTFPLLTAGTSVPAQHTETLSTQSDNQESITIDLVYGAKDLAKVVFPLHARKPRGVVMVTLLLKVDGNGTLTAFVTEQGTTNTTKREGLQLALAR